MLNIVEFSSLRIFPYRQSLHFPPPHLPRIMRMKNTLIDSYQTERAFDLSIKNKSQRVEHLWGWYFQSSVIKLLRVSGLDPETKWTNSHVHLNASILTSHCSGSPSLLGTLSQTKPFLWMASNVKHPWDDRYFPGCLHRKMLGGEPDGQMPWTESTESTEYINGLRDDRSGHSDQVDP